MYKEVLQNTEHIALWPVISFVIFFTFFIGLVWYAAAADKNHISRMGQLPLEDGNNLEY